MIIFFPDKKEQEAIEDLCRQQGLSEKALIRQALRLYQMDFMRRKAGETVTYSGDLQRAREFAGATVLGDWELGQAIANLEESIRPMMTKLGVMREELRRRSERKEPPRDRP
jgi:hypothetical protein